MTIEKYKLYYRTFIVIFWIAMTLGFVCEELLPFLEVVRPPLYLLLDFVLLFLGLAVMRQRGDIIVFISYMVLAFVSTIMINHLSVLYYFNGSRDFFGIILVVPVLRYFFTSPNSRSFQKSFDRHLFVFLCLQTPCILWQFFKYGANDHGGGTLGYGGSGIMSMMIYLISFYLISKRWDSSNFGRSLWVNRKYVLLLLPTFFNETKASFLLLICYFVLLIKFDRKAFIRLTIVVPVFFATLWGAVILYMNVTNQQTDEVFSTDFVTHYLYGEDLDEIVEIGMMVQDGDFEMDEKTWWVEDIPRFGKIALVVPMLSESPSKLLFGEGVGQFKGGTMVDNTPFFKENQWLLFGSKTWLFSLIVQLGLVGVVWFLIVGCRALFTRESHMHMHRQIELYLAANLVLIMLYNDSVRVFYFCIVLFYIALSLKYCCNDVSCDAKEFELSEKSA